MRRLVSRLIWLSTLIVLAACSGDDDQDEQILNEEEIPKTIQLTSTAFAEEESIPRQYTCDGDDLSPPLAWSNTPDGTQSLALIVDDPDAPGKTWVHWVIYAITPDTTGLEAGVPADETLDSGARQGVNDFRRSGYGGPCPPGGSSHRYFFKLYALDAVLDLAPGASKNELERAMQGHVLAEGRLMGTYARG
jgi:Raf kinase inhibitor-like YbhB/YbcL family protein